MSTVPHRASPLVRERSSLLGAREMWAAVAIVAVWLAVVAVAISGADITAQEGVAGVGTNTSVPAAVVVALFAALATWPIARYGFRRDGRDDG